MPVLPITVFILSAIACFFLARKVLLSKKQESEGSAWVAAVVTFIISLGIVWFVVWYLFFTQMEIG